MNCAESVKERGREVQELITVLSVETEADRVREKEAFQRRDRCKLKVEQSQCLLESYENQKVEKGLKIDAMLGEGGDVDREKIKMEGIMEQLASEQTRLLALRAELEWAESVVVNMAHEIEAHRLQYKALKAELLELQKGKTLGSFWPRPMVYSEEKGAGISDRSGLLEIPLVHCVNFRFLTVTLLYHLVGTCIIHIVRRLYLYMEVNVLLKGAKICHIQSGIRVLGGESLALRCSRWPRCLDVPRSRGKPCN